MSSELIICKACGSQGPGNYCSNCGQAYVTKRITLTWLIHEVFHFFTHFDKGFGYTLKQLVINPGAMQNAYVAGDRSRHQKPFSMFFICITFCALALYVINSMLVRYFHAGNAIEGSFFHQYMVLVQLILLPVYTLILFSFFYRSGYNYAEMAILQLYTFSLLFLALVLIHLVKFIWPTIQTRYIELPLIVFYGVITNLGFFREGPKWVIAVKSVVVTSLCYGFAALVQDSLIKIFH